MNDETTQTSDDQTNTSAPVAAVNEEHAAALELAAGAQAPEDQAAADALVAEAAAKGSDEPTDETVEPEPVKESIASEVHDILTTIENDIESLLHSPLALVQWVRTKVAEAKAKL